MFGIIDGAESTLNSFLLSIFQKKFHLSEMESSAYGTCLYFSAFIGILISGLITDKYGRLRPI
jgi:fucose permease